MQHEIKPNSQSTRELILEKSLRLINSQGMIDFRIDTLATSLSLSPGNITYHFSRKEDICSTLWKDYMNNYTRVQVTLTSLLDLKQVYLMNRANMILAYKYRGVLIFRSADFGAMCRDEQINRENIAKHLTITDQLYDLLIANGYAIPRKGNEDSYEFTKINHYLTLRWAINLAFQLHDEHQIKHNLDRFALLCLHTIYPVLTPKAREQFLEIAEKVKNKQI